MSASFFAKNAQSCSSPLQTTACGSPFDLQPFPKAVQRSQTADRGFRNMGNAECSFFYERPPKEEQLRERVQSPFLEGRKNENFVNPTFHSSVFLNQTMELQRSKTPKTRGSRRGSEAAVGQSVTNFKCFTDQTPRDTPVCREDAYLVPHGDVQPAPAGKGLRKGSGQEKKTRSMVEIDDERRGLHASRSESKLDVCNGCHNFNLAHETAEARRKDKNAERDLERAVLDLNSQLLRAEKEKERSRKQLIAETSNKNYDTFTQKRQRDTSVEGRSNGEYNVEIKLQNKDLASESLRILQRYQSMMDKMYDSSVKKDSQRRFDLSSNHSHNRNKIFENEHIKDQEKKSGTRVQWDLGTGKSLFDKMNDNAAQSHSHRDSEKRRASEYNCITGSNQKEARMNSPHAITEDPFKVSSATLEKSGEGRSILDNMYQSSLDYWKKQKKNLINNSQHNRENSALRRSRQQRDFQDEFSAEYATPNCKKSASQYMSEQKPSVFDKMADSDQKSAGIRHHRTRDCSGYNKSQGFVEENAKLKANLEEYYNSPTKKVGQTYDIDSDADWTQDKKSLLHKINKNSATLDENRKTQLAEVGSKIKRQMEESTSKKKEQQTKDRNFKQEPLLVCSHKANLMYCNLCNRKVPMNKITKVTADYNKLIKNRDQRSRK